MVLDIFSSILGWLDQGTGNNNNTWGDNCDVAIFPIFEKAIAGLASHAVTGGTLDLSTVTPPAGASSALEYIRKFSGTLGSNQLVQVPNVPKAWLVRNDCVLGAFSLKFKTSAGAASAAIPNATSIVWCDGSNNIFVGPSTIEGQFLAFDGSLAAPGIAFTNQLDTGLRHTGYATGSLSNPFSTVNGSATVTVAHTTHGLTTNDVVSYVSGSVIGGLDLNSVWVVASTPDANTYTFTADAAANATVNNSGGGPTYEYLKAAATGKSASLDGGGADQLQFTPFGVRIFNKLLLQSDVIYAINKTVTQTHNTAGTITHEGISTEPGASAGPIISAYRRSLSPAASDVIGVYDFYGKDSAGNKQLYARMQGQINDPTSAAEIGNWQLQVVVAGVLTTVLQATSTTINIPANLTVTGNLTITGLLIPSKPAKTTQYLTAVGAGTYTTPAGCRCIHAKWIGGGAGGGSTGSNDGSNGGATTFNGVTANGGTGGSAGNLGTRNTGAGGTGGGGSASLRLPGSAGQSQQNGADFTVPGGTGGPGIFGMGAGAGNSGGGAAGATNTGAGGAGGAGTSSAGGGGSGEYCELIIQTPAATYNFSIGDGGNGGTGGQVGGKGGSGIIIVDEYY